MIPVNTTEAPPPDVSVRGEPAAINPDTGAVTAVTDAQAIPTARATESPSPASPRRRRHWLRYALLAMLAGAAALAAWHAPTRERIREAMATITRFASEPDESEGEGMGQPPPKTIPKWNGRVEITPEQARTIGLETAETRPQTEPTHLEINGTTAYDPNTEVQIRPRFDSLINKVYVQLGQKVKAGDPLVDLFSAELAAAKNDYEKAQAHWEHDKKELERAERLFKDQPPAISEKEYLATASDEKVSRADAKVAADKLLVYGVPPAVIARVRNEIGTEKARMTLLAPADGVVIRKEVVQGNRYSDTDVLMVIAPLDYLWVWGNVYPSDATRVQIGQRWLLRCPMQEQEIPSRIESITSEIAQDTKTLRIRTEIPNVGGRLKADLLVSGYIEIPPVPGQVVVPRLALVSTDGADYVFVARPHSDAEKSREFERRQVRVVEERRDAVIVGAGLQAGEVVATRGSLLLSQLYEDAAAVEPEAPLSTVASH